MKNFEFKYGKSYVNFTLNKDHIVDVLIPNDESKIEDIKKETYNVLNNPTNSKPLCDLVNPGEKICIIISDITRLWVKIDQCLIHIVNYLSELGVKDDDIYVVIALGGHRPSTPDEMKSLVGEEVYNRISIYDHDAFDDDNLVYIGNTKRETPVYLNKKVHEADKVILTGGIVFHIFAGFGGGSKSILPGVVGMKTIQHNHRLAFNPGFSSGLNLDAGPNKIIGNPLREDMNDACSMSNPTFLFNVVLDTYGNFIKFVGGHHFDAWNEGCDFIRDLYGINLDKKADITIASAGGYPKDINLYQTVKTIDNALYAGDDDSVMVILSECSDGLGADEFNDWFKYETLEDMENALKRNFTVPGYVAYKTAYASRYRKLILLSSLNEDVVKNFNIIPCKTIDEAIKMAYSLVDSDNPKVTLMPYGGNTLPISLS